MGARPLAMGGCYVAFANDLNAIFYNPAGIAGIKENNISYTRVLNNRESINLKENIAFCNGTKEVGMGSSYLHLLNIDWEDGYADLDHDGNRDSDEPYLGEDNNIAIFTIAGYGEGSLKRTAFGINFKRFSQSLMQSYGIGKGFSKIGTKKEKIAFDIGILSHLSKDISIGLVIYNINEPKFVYESLNINNNIYDHKITYPLILTSGICINVDDNTIIGIDLYGINNINDWYSQNEDDREQSSIRFGFERWIGENFIIRGGYGEGFHSAGFGIKAKNIICDYGLLERGNIGFHVISLTLTQR